MSLDPKLQLTEKELSSRLFRDTSNHPITLSSGVLGVLCAIGATLFASTFFFPALAIASAIGIASCAGFLITKTVLTKHKAMLEIIEKVRKETIEKRQKISVSIETDLTNFQDSKALKQLRQLHKKFNAFENILNHQFDKDEFTHKRYLTTAEQLYFGAVNNLNNLVMLWHSTSAIDSEHLKQQLESETTDTLTIQALEKRLGIYEQSQTDIANILIVNEQAMTKLDELTSKLGSIQTREGLNEVRLDTAMSEILHLISRTDKYDIRNQ